MSIELVLTRSDGGAFHLVSIDLAELEANQSPGSTLEFRGTKLGGGTVTQSFQLDGVAFGAEPFQFSPEFRSLTSVRWTQGDQQIDNILAPEPSRLLVHASALLGLAALVRARRARAASASAKTTR